MLAANCIGYLKPLSPHIKPNLPYFLPSRIVGENRESSCNATSCMLATRKFFFVYYPQPTDNEQMDRQTARQTSRKQENEQVLWAAKSGQQQMA